MRAKLLIVAAVAAIATCGLLSFVGCGNDRNPVIPVISTEPVPGNATNILLSVYSDGWGTLLDTFTVASEGDVVIDIDEADPYSDPPAYYIYAEADNYYTELYKCLKGDTISVDLDSVRAVHHSIAGVIFSTQSFFSDCYLSDGVLSLSGPNRFLRTIATDSLGRYSAAGLPTGEYAIEIPPGGPGLVFHVSNSAGTDYEDLSFIEPIQVLAPNIYLYPETTTTIDVSLNFPVGGHVTVSSPPYGSGWTVSVSPDGIIDDEFDYLFYEASLPPNLSTDYGWLLNADDLENEFRVLLTDLGFYGREIDDFIDYWVPIMNNAPYYGIYPQDVNSLIELTINPAPTSSMRQLFLIRAQFHPLDMPPPPDNGQISREGYVAVEWGVIASGLGPIEH